MSQMPMLLHSRRYIHMMQLVFLSVACVVSNDPPNFLAKSKINWWVSQFLLLFYSLFINVHKCHENRCHLSVFLQLYFLYRTWLTVVLAACRLLFGKQNKNPQHARSCMPHCLAIKSLTFAQLHNLSSLQFHGQSFFFIVMFHATVSLRFQSHCGKTAQGNYLSFTADAESKSVCQERSPPAEGLKLFESSFRFYFDDCVLSLFNFLLAFFNSFVNSLAI